MIISKETTALLKQLAKRQVEEVPYRSWYFGNQLMNNNDQAFSDYCSTLETIPDELYMVMLSPEVWRGFIEEAKTNDYETRAIYRACNQ